MKHLITAGLPYINGIKHLGNLIGSMLPADVYARFLRQRGHDVLYICGTDEHGAPAELAAEEAKEPVDVYCERLHQTQADIYARFGITCDLFGRSSNPANHQLTKQIFLELETNGFISRKTLRQFYSTKDARFLADRYIIGTCPNCRFERARGDQCENCTKLLDPIDLKNPRSAISGSGELELRESAHLFLDLEKLQPRVQAWANAQTQWPDLTRQIAQQWLQEGLHQRCITRNLKWGVSVPLAGFEELVFYVWFDAPIGYIGITHDWATGTGRPDAWKEYWIGGSDVRYTQFMGKDNLPFHTLMFPAMLLGASTPWKLADQIKGFHWLDYYGGKFSTSSKRGIFTDVALELYPADYWRYALMAMVPEGGDSTFKWPMFAGVINKDLAQILGNFANRLVQFTSKKFGNALPSGGEPGPAETELQNRARETVEDFTKSMHALELRSAMKAMRALWTYGNQYLDERAPWKTIKTDEATTALTIRTAFNYLALSAVVALPVIPTIAGRFLTALGIDPAASGMPEDYLALTRLPAGHPFETLPPAVTQIEDTEIEALESRFGK